MDGTRAEELPHHQRLVVDGLWPAGAIAAKLARPELPVVCLIGDGCFQMTCGEVATAKRLGLTLPIVVLDDNWLALIKVKQIRRQFPLYGTELQDGGVSRAARALFRRARGRRA